VAKDLVCIMEFCPECGTRMVTRRKKDGTKVTVETVCPKCGHKKAAKNSAEAAAKSIKRPSKESITVIGKEHQIHTLPTTRTACPKCGNNLAYVWQVQTRGGDEGSTQFFRCTKCNHTFREYT
jgi:DNA-directed RNA polymerase subunit M